MTQMALPGLERRRRGPPLLALGVVLLCVLGLSAAGAYLALRGDSSQAAPVDPGWIVFVSQGYDGSDLYVLRPDGSDLRRVTKDGLVKQRPVWSPDGRIAYTSGTMRSEVRVVNSDGTEMRSLTGTGSNNMLASWSPDGSKLAFTSDRAGSPQIFVMNADGSGVLRLTTGFESAYYPDWSPDGRRIVFFGDSGAPSDVYVINVDGSGLKRLTYQPSACCPDWSPDGSSITYSADGRDGGMAIWVANADGSNARPVTAGPTADSHPSWSPDGSRIVYASFRDGNYILVTIARDGTDERVLYQDSRESIAPTWWRPPHR